MTVTVSEHFVDILFDFPDGHQLCVSVFKDGRYRAMERTKSWASWGPPVEGSVVK